MHKWNKLVDLLALTRKSTEKRLISKREEDDTMGDTPYEIASRKSKRLAREEKELESANELADRVLSLINSKVIRPGPKPEERECTQVASEILALKPDIVELILA